MMHQVMFQCGDFLISGIVAVQAGTGVVSIPADFRTGGGFCFVTHQVMFQCGDFLISGIVAAQAGTGFVGVPPLFRAGGGLRCVLHQSMIQRGQFRIGGMVAAGAGFVGVPADFRTSGGFCCVLHQIMVFWVFFAVFPTTHLTDRFGAAGCCATGTACSINFGAARAAAGVRAVAVNRRPLAPVVIAVVTPSANIAHSQTGAVRVAAAAASSLFCVAALASAGVRAVAGVVRRPRAPVVTENAVFRAAFFTGFACGAGERSGAAGMLKCMRNIAILVAGLAYIYINLMIGRIIFFVSEHLTVFLTPTEKAAYRDCFCRFNV